LGDARYHLYVIRVCYRDDLARHLAASSIATGIHYPAPPYCQPAYRDLPLPHDLNVGDLDALHRDVLSLPIGPHLSDTQVDHVIDVVSSFSAMDQSDSRRRE
jgi:dTDP-3-amino-3,4,6-trideoxy-alpha-D-glucose transaminase